MLPAIPATCLPDKAQEGRGQESSGGASGHGKEKHVLLAFICIKKHRASHQAVGLRGSGGTRGHTQGGWRALHAAVPRLGLANTEQQSSREPAKNPHQCDLCVPGSGEMAAGSQHRELYPSCLLSSPSAASFSIPPAAQAPLG